MNRRGKVEVCLALIWRTEVDLQSGTPEGEMSQGLRVAVETPNGCRGLALTSKGDGRFLRQLLVPLPIEYHRTTGRAFDVHGAC